MKNVNTASAPFIETRAEKPYLGIRVQTPMRGMGAVIGKTLREVQDFMRLQEIEPAGPPFIRYHVIDMAGEMDIEMGVPVAVIPSVAGITAGSGRVRAGVLPAGRYAALTYSGSGIAGNRKLIEWAKASGLAWDRWDDPRGDAFRSRYESYLTDPKIEPRKTLWQVEVAIKLKD